MSHIHIFRGKYFALRFRGLFWISRGLHKPDMPETPYDKFWLNRKRE